MSFYKVQVLYSIVLTSLWSDSGPRLALRRKASELTRCPHLDGAQRNVRQLLPGDNDASTCCPWWTLLSSPLSPESLQEALSSSFCLLLLRASIRWSPGRRLPGRAHEGQNVHHCTNLNYNFPFTSCGCASEYVNAGLLDTARSSNESHDSAFIHLPSRVAAWKGSSPF